MIQLFKFLACAGRNLFQFNLDSWTSGCIRKQFERTYSWHWLVLLRTLVKIMCNLIFACCSERRNQSVVHCIGRFGQVDPKVFIGIMIYIQPSCKMSLSVNRRRSSASLAMRRDALQPDTAGVVVLFATWIWWSFVHVGWKLTCFVSVSAYCHGHTKRALEFNIGLNFQVF